MRRYISTVFVNFDLLKNVEVTQFIVGYDKLSK